MTDDTSTPPHGDPLRSREKSGASRHGVQLDPRGQPDDAERRPDERDTPRSHPAPGQTP